MKVKQKAKVTNKFRSERGKSIKYSVTVRPTGKGCLSTGRYCTIDLKGVEIYDAVSIGDEVTITVEVKS